MEGILKPITGGDEKKILVLGLKGTGKSTILAKINLADILTSTPTGSFQLETVEYKNIKFVSWDLGGQSDMMPVWRKYFNNVCAVVFVVDCSDDVMMMEAADELNRLSNEDGLVHAHLLVMANKQDVIGSLAPPNVTQHLKLYNMKGRRHWHIQATCATSGDGLAEGFQWLVQRLHTSSS